MDITKYTQEWGVNAWLELPLPYKMVYWAYWSGEVSKGQASKACEELDELYSNLDKVKRLADENSWMRKKLDYCRDVMFPNLNDDHLCPPKDW